MTLKPKLNLRYMLWKGIGSLVFDVSVKRVSLIVYVLKFFWNFGGSAWQCCGKRERFRILPQISMVAVHCMYFATRGTPRRRLY